MLLAGLLVAHGLVHALGFVWTWGVAEVPELGEPTLVLSNRAPGDPALVAFGLLWLVTMLAFVAAGIALARDMAWAPALAGIAAGISLAPTTVWWGDAWFGALLSGAILLIVVGTRTRSARAPSMTTSTAGPGESLRR